MDPIFPDLDLLKPPSAAGTPLRANFRKELSDLYFIVYQKGFL
jgi:hypothetical protein